jgi:hypothetical protein
MTAKRPIFVFLLMLWLGLLLGFAFAEPTPQPQPEAVPLSWVGEALDQMPFILSGRR